MRLVAYGTNALLLDGLDPALPPREVDSRLRRVPGVRDVLVADGSALLEFGDAPPVDPRPYLDTPSPASTAGPAHHEVRVVYDGPDLDAVARAVRVSREEVVRRHVAGRYVVQLVGFQPGFAYLGPLDPAIDVPRLPQPRRRVPPCSVAIAAGRTAIYPQASPGGWNLLGRAVDFVPFDPANGARLRLGDEVRFVEAT